MHRRLVLACLVTGAAARHNVYAKNEASYLIRCSQNIYIVVVSESESDYDSKFGLDIASGRIRIEFCFWECSSRTVFVK